MEKEVYLVWQMQVDKRELVGYSHNTQMSTIIRKVHATSKEEAMGKFIFNTAEEPAHQKLAPMCIKLDELKTIE